ncbi:MAG: sensor histidine kinase [Myxococcales bacterium]
MLQLVSNLLAHALDRSSETTAISLAWSGTAHGVFVEVDYEPDAPGADRDIGLGLSVARRIALAHGGDIRKSHTSSGTRLRVDLPRWIPVRAVLTAGCTALCARRVRRQLGFIRVGISIGSDMVARCLSSRC